MRSRGCRGAGIPPTICLHRAWSRRLAAAAVLLTVTGAALAADEVPGPFAWTVGAWEGVRRDGATGEAAPMRMVVEPVLGGTGYLRRLEVDGPDGPYRGIAIQIHDAAAGTWRWIYTGAGRGAFVEYEAGSIDGTRSVWQPIEPRERLSRLTSELVDGVLWRRTMEVSEDGGGSWRVLWTDELRRADRRSGAL